MGNIVKTLVAEVNGIDLEQATERVLDANDVSLITSLLSSQFVKDALEEIILSEHSGYRYISPSKTITIKSDREMRVKSLKNEGTVKNFGYLVID